MTFIAAITLVVRDYDEAIRFYCDVLGFELLEDTELSPEKRWVRVAPPGQEQFSLLLAKAKNEQEIASIGNQTGGRVGFFLHTDTFDDIYQKLLEHKITIVRPPEKQIYGKVCVFTDLYGNLWDLIGKNQEI